MFGNKFHLARLELANTARDHIDTELQKIDAALADEEELRRQLQVGVDYGNLTPEEADEYLAAYHHERFEE